VIDQEAPNLYAPPKSDVADANDPTDLVYATRMERFGAYLLDWFLKIVLVVPLIAGVILDVSDLLNSETKMFTILGFGLAGMGVLAWIGLTVYFVHRNGQSIAKRMIGIKVVRTDGSRASLARIFWLRNVVNSLAGMMPGLGWLYFLVDSSIIFGGKQQCLHDMIADTLVVKA
jgi:uncharacterized RDD family membrane protein YckC